MLRWSLMVQNVRNIRLFRGADGEAHRTCWFGVPRPLNTSSGPVITRCGQRSSSCGPCQHETSPDRQTPASTPYSPRQSQRPLQWSRKHDQELMRRVTYSTTHYNNTNYKELYYTKTIRTNRSYFCLQHEPLCQLTGVFAPPCGCCKCCLMTIMFLPLF